MAICHNAHAAVMTSFADDAERYMGLTQIDLIKQILLFSSAVSAISARNYQSSRRWRRKGKYNKRRRCLTMLNRWQAHKGAACGEVASIIMCLEVAQHCSTSSTPNDSEVSVPRRLRFAPPAVMHGLPSTMAPRCGRWAYCHTPKSLSQKPRKGD